MYQHMNGINDFSLSLLTSCMYMKHNRYRLVKVSLVRHNGTESGFVLYYVVIVHREEISGLMEHLRLEFEPHTYFSGVTTVHSTASMAS